jgi:type II secretion system protein G
MARRVGFTLVELLIVIVIIAVIAAIAIPKFMNSSQRAQEAAVKQQLQLLRDAMSRFNSDTGMWPINADDMTGQTAPAQAYNGGGLVKSLDATTYKGPYISSPTIPSNLSGWIQYGWVSTSAKAQFSCPMSGNALDGTPYSSW